MIIKKDYIMRMIHEMIRTLLKLIFNIEIEKVEEVELLDEETAKKYQLLRNMIDEGMINEAENMLINELDLFSRNELEMALLFYHFLNNKEEEFLEKHNYSRVEIYEGIKFVCDKYGYGGYTGIFEDKF